MSQRNNPNLQRHRDNDESAFKNLHHLITQLTNREPNSSCDTLEEALRLMRDLPAENERIKRQLAMAGRHPAEPYDHGRMGHTAYGQQTGGCQQRRQERRLP